MTSSPQPSKERVSLSGVSETAMLTLKARAQEARRPNGIIDDPMAIGLVDSIDFDFAKFGPTGQDIALRAKACRPVSGAWTPPFRAVNSVG
jgi:O-methyltransferase involved in polyketide biosynthesis